MIRAPKTVSKTLVREKDSVKILVILASLTKQLQRAAKPYQDFVLRQKSGDFGIKLQV